MLRDQRTYPNDNIFVFVGRLPVPSNYSQAAPYTRTLFGSPKTEPNFKLFLGAML